MLDKITNSEISEVNVKSTQGPRLLGTVAENKNVFDKFCELISAKFNKVVDTLNSPDGASNVQSTAVKEGGATNVQGALAELNAETAENTENRHNHVNKSVIDLITSAVKQGYDALVTLFAGITGIEKTLTATDSKLPTSKAVNTAINERVVEIGAGDMAKAIYDKDNAGSVDNAKKLGGQPSSFYAEAAATELALDEMASEVAKKGNTDTIKLENIQVAVESWIASETYQDYPFKVTIQVPGVTEADWNCILVTPDHTDRSLDGVFFSYVFTGDGFVEIYIEAVPDHEATFENMVFQRVVS